MPGEDLLKHHPITIEDMVVKELSIRAEVHPEEAKDKFKEFAYSITVGHSNYDHDKKEVDVALILQTNKEEEAPKAPFTLKVEIIAKFKVDEEKFSQEHVDDWAKRNAPLILYPYLREHAYALTVRCGFKPFMLPLLQVPTFKNPKKKAKKEA